MAPPSLTELSEYKKLLAELSRNLEGVQPSDLTKDNVAFIVGMTGINQERILILEKHLSFLEKQDYIQKPFTNFLKGLTLKIGEAIGSEG